MKFWEKYKIDLIVDSRKEYKKAVLSLLEVDRSANLLDLGSGDFDRFTGTIANQVDAKEVTCIDIHGIGETIFGKLWGKPCMFHKHDLNEPLPVQEEFDVVISTQVIEHLWNTDLFLKEIHRVLKPTGYAGPLRI